MDELMGGINLLKRETKSLVTNINYQLAYQLGMLILRLYRQIFSIQFCLRGVENVPMGSKILAANHPNVSDVFLLPLVFNGKIKAVAQYDLFHTPIIGWIFRNTGQIPVYPERRIEAYKQACRALGRGDTVLIFPEGRLNPDENQCKVGSGTVRMAIKTHTPIIPIGIHVSKKDTIDITRDNDPGKKILQIQGKFFVNIGKPWNPLDLIHTPCKISDIQDLTKCLMDKIFQLKKETQNQELWEPVPVRS